MHLAGVFMGVEQGVYEPPDKPGTSYPFAFLKVGDGEHYIKVKSGRGKHAELVDAFTGVKVGDKVEVPVWQDRFNNLRYADGSKS